MLIVTHAFKTLNESSAHTDSMVSVHSKKFIVLVIKICEQMFFHEFCSEQTKNIVKQNLFHIIRKQSYIYGIVNS